jgi:hypothetical protein
VTKIYSCLVIVFTLLCASLARAAGGQGIFLISNCSAISSPVAYATWCVQSSASDPNIKYWNGSTYVSVTSTSGTVLIANEGTTGTTTAKLAKLVNAPLVAEITAITDFNGAVGIVVGGAGTTGTASISQTGLQSCVFDGGTVAGDYVQISTTVAGDCHDAGASIPGTGEIVGRVTSTNGSGGTYILLLSLASIPAMTPSIYTHTISGATPTFLVEFTTTPSVDIENDPLTTNVTSIITPGSTAMADGEIIQAKFVQPSGGHNYTLPGSFTAGAGTTVVLTPGCPALPSMPTGANHSLLFDMIYNASITEMDVVSCVATGS